MKIMQFLFLFMSGLMKKSENSLPDVSLSHKIKGLQKNPQWRNNNVTYRILNYTADISPADLDTATERALNVWSSVTPLTFTRLDDGEADIMILFGAEALSLASNTLPVGSQHVFSLRHGSPETHFDADETWTMGFNRYNMFIVAAHEFGRALDLSHSAAPGALIFCLPLGDVNGIQALFFPYSTRLIIIPPKKKLHPTHKTPEKCDPNLSFDAVVGLQGEMMFFKDKLSVSRIRYWAIDGYNILPGYPKYIHRWDFVLCWRQILEVRQQHSHEYSCPYWISFYIKPEILSAFSYDEIKQIMDKGYPQQIIDD
uniref:Peptidase metallopeptidase domain-containing protein n=1 Tax=Callorhinchus milii TaxID=7868 RepID=A0A4W3HQK2_CALMI